MAVLTQNPSGETRILMQKFTLVSVAVAFGALAKAIGMDLPSDAILVGLATVFALMMLQRPNLHKRVLPVFFSFGAYVLLYLGLTLADPTATGFKNTIGAAVSLVFFFFGVIYARDMAKGPGNAAIFIGTSLLCVMVVNGLTETSKNTISGLSIYLLLAAGALLVHRNPNRNVYAVAIFLVLLFVGLFLNHRMAQGASLIAFGVYFAVILAPFQWFRRLILLGLVCSILLLLALYAGLWGLDIRDFNDEFVALTGRNAASGRQIIWPIILTAVSNSKIFGIGTGTNFSSLYDSSWSAHSFYLQVYMQVGFAGLAVFVLTLLSIWRAIGTPRGAGRASAFATATIVIVILHSSTEVFLTQVNLMIGATAWLALGLTVGLVLQSTSEDNTLAKQPSNDSIARNGTGIRVP